MKINKTWIVGLLGYIVYFVKQFVPTLEVPDALLDNIADVVLLLMGIIPMIANMLKKKEAQHPFEGVQTSVDQKPFGDHGPAI